MNYYSDFNIWAGSCELSLARAFAVRLHKESEEASDKEPNYLWPFWVAEYAHLKGRKPHSAETPFLMRWL